MNRNGSLVLNRSRWCKMF